MKNLDLTKVFLTFILLLGVVDVESYIGLALFDEQKNILFIWTALAIAFPKFCIPLLLGGFGWNDGEIEETTKAWQLILAYRSMVKQIKF